MGKGTFFSYKLGYLYFRGESNGVMGSAVSGFDDRCSFGSIVASMVIMKVVADIDHAFDLAPFDFNVAHILIGFAICQ